MSMRNLNNLTNKPSGNSKKMSCNIVESTIINLLVIIKLLMLFIVLTITEILIITFLLWM